MKYTPHEYQKRAIDFVIEHPYCGLFLDMGLGKTVSTLTAVQQLMDEYLEVRRVLVIAPKSVAQNTWTTETAKWDHTRHLRISVIMGSAARRERALASDADIYVINRDNTEWLVNRYLGKRWPFDMVILDESSSFKNPQSRRFKALRKVRPEIDRIVELTGTPSPNGLMDLWSQIYLLDRGQRLCRTLGAYRAEHFRAGMHNGFTVYEWKPLPGAHDRITALISDICLSMQASDYLQLPDFIEAGTDIALPEADIKRYREFERDCLMDLDSSTITADTAAALSNKLLQFTGGAVYDTEHDWHEVSTVKLEALEDIIEQANEPVLVYYAYQSEKERIMEHLKDYYPVAFKGEPDILEKWNRGEIRVLLCHPASVAYGLNMQRGGHIIVWYTMSWNLELYQQANARLHRQGQEKPVLIYHLTALGTIDERVKDALRHKGSAQLTLLQTIRDMLVRK